MNLRPINPTVPPPPIRRAGAASNSNLSLVQQVQSALNLGLPLRDRAQMPALLQTIASVQQTVDEALTNLHYVHFARFLPTPDFGTLQVITTYDGDLNSYLMDFVVVLGDVFNAILAFVEGAPPLPVQKYPQEFVNFVIANNIPASVWSAYPTMSVIDILKAPPSVR